MLRLVTRKRPKGGLNLTTTTISRTIEAFKYVASAAEMAPFPWVGALFELGVQVLETIQRMYENRDRMKNLADRVMRSLIAVRDAVIAQQQTSLSRFRTTCVDFTDCLASILSDLNAMGRQDHGRLRQYFRATEIADEISEHENRLSELCQNLILTSVVETRFQVCSVDRKLDSVRSDGTDKSSSSPGETDIHGFRQLSRSDVELRRQLRRSAIPLTSESQESTVDIVSRSVEYIDWVAQVYGTTSERVVRVYQGPNGRQALDKELNAYKDLWHSNVLQVFGVVLSPTPALVFNGSYKRTLQDHINTLMSAQDWFSFDCQFNLDLKTAAQYLASSQCDAAIDSNVLIDPATGHFCIVELGTGSASQGGVVLSGDSQPWDGIDKNYGGAFQSPHLTESNLSAILKTLQLGKSPSIQDSRRLLSMFYALLSGSRHWCDKKLRSRSGIAAPILTKEVPVPLSPMHADEYTIDVASLGCILIGDPYDEAPEYFGHMAMPPADFFQTNRIPLWESKGNKCITMPLAGPNGRYTRVEFKDPRDILVVKYYESLRVFFQDTWLCQAHSVIERKMYGALNLEDLNVVNGFYLALCFSQPLAPPACPVELAQRGDLQYKVYIFLEDSLQLASSIFSMRDIFWSSDPKGRIRWTDLEIEQYLDRFGLKGNNINLHIDFTSFRWRWFHYGILHNVHSAFGFDPYSLDVAKLLGLSPVQIDRSHKVWHQEISSIE